LDGGFAPYDTYETKDGKFMACGSLEPQFYNNLLIGYLFFFFQRIQTFSFVFFLVKIIFIFLKGLGLNESDEITREVLEEKFKEKTQHEWKNIFDKLDACVSPVLSLDEAPHLQHSIERNSFIKTNDDNWLPTMSWLNNDERNRSFEMPKIGQHTSIILRELGYTNEQIDEMIKENIVQQDSSNHVTSKL
jgi:alpha-methylacyl-CoA racemase